MASADILRAARARIEDPKNWTQGDYARDAHGQLVKATDPGACKFCALGALAAEGVMFPEGCSEGELLRKAARKMFDCGIVRTNDNLGHAAVLQVYDAAIAAAEAEAGR